MDTGGGGAFAPAATTGDARLQPGWDTYVERPGYGLEADIAFEEVTADCTEEILGFQHPQLDAGYLWRVLVPVIKQEWEALQVQPELRRRAEEMRETQGSVAGDRRLTLQDGRDAVCWDAKLPRQLGAAMMSWNALVPRNGTEDCIEASQAERTVVRHCNTLARRLEGFQR